MMSTKRTLEIAIYNILILLLSACGVAVIGKTLWAILWRYIDYCCELDSAGITTKR
jgi:hypothetical protein